MRSMAVALRSSPAVLLLVFIIYSIESFKICNCLKKMHVSVVFWHLWCLKRKTRIEDAYRSKMDLPEVVQRVVRDLGRFVGLLLFVRAWSRDPVV